MVDYISEYTGDELTDIIIFQWNSRLMAHCYARDVTEACMTGPCQWCPDHWSNNVPEKIEHFVREY